MPAATSGFRNLGGWLTSQGALESGLLWLWQRRLLPSLHVVCIPVVYASDCARLGLLAPSCFQSTIAASQSPRTVVVALGPDGVECKVEMLESPGLLL